MRSGWSYLERITALMPDLGVLIYLLTGTLIFLTIRLP